MRNRSIAAMRSWNREIEDDVFHYFVVREQGGAERRIDVTKEQFDQYIAAKPDHTGTPKEHVAFRQRDFGFIPPMIDEPVYEFVTTATIPVTTIMDRRQPLEVFEPYTKWCDENCIGKYQFDRLPLAYDPEVETGEFQFMFAFENERDAVLFKTFNS